MTTTPAQTTEAVEEAAERVRRFLDGRAMMTANLDPEEIHSVWVQREDEARILLMSDLRLLLAQLAMDKPHTDTAVVELPRWMADWISEAAASPSFRKELLDIGYSTTLSVLETIAEQLPPEEVGSRSDG